MMKFRSLRYKLLFILLVIGLFPFVTFLLLSLNEAEKAIQMNIKYELKAKNDQLKHSIEKEFFFYKNQVSLWSQYQIMDDILVNDIDKRISNFIRKVKASSNNEGEIVVTNKVGKIISSTKKGFLFKRFPIEILDFHRFTVVNFYGKFLCIYSPIYASFKDRLIGYIIFMIQPETLKKFNSYEKGHFSYVFNKEFLPLENLNFETNQSNKFFESKSSFFYQQMLSKNIFKDNWYILTGVDKSVAFSPIITIKNSLLLIGFLGTFGIVLISLLISRIVINPIEKLTKFADSVAKNKDYSSKIDIHSDDEISILAHSFNNLLYEINLAIEQLKRESRERLILFTKLIDFFNKLTETKNKDEVFSVMKEYIKDFVDCDITFIQNEREDIRLKCFPVSYKDYSTNMEVNEGKICFSLSRELSNEEEKFFSSIAKLVSLWIERLNMIEQLRVLLEKAQSSSKAKSIFITNMSHELRTPLNSIIGFSHIIETSDELSEEYRDMAKSIRVSGEHLLSLINDILDFAKAEANKIKVKKELFKLNELLEDIYMIIKPIADKKGLELILQGDKDISVYTDKKLLKQILINLLSNAVKFTDKGYIKVDVKKENSNLSISVTDTGIGIAKENIEKIFEDFQQIENPLQKKYKGTGLGLALVKRLVFLLNGRIEVKSEGIGKGSTFIIVLKNV